MAAIERSAPLQHPARRSSQRGRTLMRPVLRQDAWVYGSLLLTALCGASLPIIVTVQMHWVSESIRSRIHPGQTISEVLSAAEATLAAQGVLTSRRALMTYMVTVHCDDRLWSLWRDSGRDGGAEFRIHVAGSDTPLHSLPERVPPTRDEVFRFAEANARGCTVHVSANGIVVTVGDDGRVAEIEPPRR